MLRYRKIVDTCDGMVDIASRTMKAYHMSLPITHGSIVHGKPLPRGTDICDGASADVSRIRTEAAHFYRRANAFFYNHPANILA